MKYGYCFIGVCPVRKEPSHKSEQVTQLLFGDFVEVLQDMGEWVEIRNLSDSYLGYIDSRNIILTSEIQEYKFYSTVPLSYISTDTHYPTPIPFGAKIIDLNYNIGKHSFKVENSELTPVNCLKKSDLHSLISKFINVPYLWGGKSIMGIDCSGLMQVVYSVLNINLPRDASEQYKIGTEILSLESAKDGDLCFFGKDKEHISHVGMYFSDNKIIHSSGRVREDCIDNKGIKPLDKEGYSHILQGIRRIS
ncbi:MAG: C40 family peptidase [Bacteroidales bacterium]|nr:C40 family peptidase [Bacteroidales bacterium]